MPYRVRPCTLADQSRVVPLIYSSGPQTFRYVFSIDHQHQAVEFLHYAYQCEQGQFSYRKHTAIVVDDTEADVLAGVGCLATGADFHHCTWHNLKQILAFYGLRKGLQVLARGLQVERIIPPPANNVGYISNLGMAIPGQGFGSRLIEHFRQQALTWDVSTLALDVADSNRNARRLYERLGFIAEKIRPSARENQWGRLEGHTYMAQPLLERNEEADQPASSLSS